MEGPKAPRGENREGGYIFGGLGGTGIVHGDPLIVPDFEEDLKELNQVLVDLGMDQGVTDGVDVPEGPQHPAPEDHGHVGEPAFDGASGHHGFGA